MLLSLLVRTEIYVTRSQDRTHYMSRVIEFNGGACAFDSLFQFEVAVGSALNVAWTVFPDNLLQ